MFPGVTLNERVQIGARNIDSIRAKLTEVGLPLSDEDVGGTTGRSISFFLNEGRVSVTKSI
jgi:chemotaxis receptor (MCP) glutamine deamidase CheD